MLSAKRQSKSLRAALDVIAVLAEESKRMSHLEPLHVEAKVKGKVVVDDVVPVLFMNRLDVVRISLMWEEAGYRGYKAMGLYGYSDTNWVEVTYDNEFIHVVSDAYVLRVTIPKK